MSDSKGKQIPDDKGEKIKIPLSFEKAVRAALEVSPEKPRKPQSGRPKKKLP
jgi:hypothetical protein